MTVLLKPITCILIPQVYLTSRELANKLGLNTKEILSCLEEEGYIDLSGGKEELSEKGLRSGAEYQKMYAVWPKSWMQEPDRIGIYCCECEKIVKPSLADGKKFLSKS